MQRYNDARTAPLSVRLPNHEAEHKRLTKLTHAFLNEGGALDQIGSKMTENPTSSFVNLERSAAYAHLFEPPKADEQPQPQDLEPTGSDEEEIKFAALIMADAAQGRSPKWIARKYPLTEKRVRQIARDYHITFHSQR